MSETQSSYSPDSGHMATHEAEQMGQSLTSNGTESAPHKDQFQELFAAGAGNLTLEEPAPDHWQPLSITEIHRELKDNPSTARVVSDAKLSDYVKTLASGPPFSQIISVALEVTAQERQKHSSQIFDAQGTLRVPWTYVLSKTLKEARAVKKKNERPVDIPSKKITRLPKKIARRSQATTESETPQSNLAQTPTGDVCQSCRLIPIAGDGESDTLCSDCAKSSLKSTKVGQKYGKQRNNKRVKMSDNSELVLAVPETPQASTRVEVQISQHLPSPRGTRPSDLMELSQSPDPLGFEGDPIPSSRRKQDTSNKFIIKFSHKETPSSVPGSQDASALCSPADPDPRMVTPIRNTSVPDSRIDAPTRSTSVRDSRQLINYSQVCTNCKRAACICSPTQESPQSVKSTSEQPLNNGQSSPTSMAAISIEATPLHGQAWLDHEEEICQPLERLTGLLSSYAGTALRLVSATRVPFLDLACVRNEDTKHPLVPVLRGLLEIHEGVSIRAHIESLSFEPGYSMWVKVVMMSLIKHFVFESGSPFEDTTILKKGLSYSGLLPDMLEEVVQDYQIRTMHANPEQAPNFFKRKRVRQDAFVKRLNGIMHALVSSNNEINSFHVEIAEIASALNMNMKAYKGVYEPIYPGRGVLFDPNLHAIDRPEVLGPGFNPNHLKGNLILFTVVVGVRYKTAGRDWIIVAKAKVRLWQPVLPNKVTLPPNKRRIEQTIDD